MRVSTEEQAREGLSMEAQKEKIRSFAKLHNLDLIEIFADEGASGKNLDRDGIETLIKKIEGQQHDSVIVYKLDRLSRRTRDLLLLIEDVFAKGNTRLFSITEQIDTDTAIGKFFLTLMGAMAQMERELISERTKTVLEHKKKLGHSLGHIPFGFNRVDGKLVKSNYEQKIIRNIKRWKREGKSYQWIADKLNEKGVSSRRGKKWHKSSLWCILNR